MSQHHHKSNDLFFQQKTQGQYIDHLFIQNCFKSVYLLVICHKTDLNQAHILQNI